MSIHTFFKFLTSTSTRRRPTRRRPPALRLAVEALEDRCLLSTGLSFAEPVFFDTGADPSSEALNIVLAPEPDPVRLPLAVAVGDFDGDGNDDVAAANPYAETISIFRGDGAGMLELTETQSVNQAVAGFDVPRGTGPAYITVGDWDNDGDLDLAVANHSSKNVTILLGAGDGTFDFSELVAVESNPSGIVAGDFNGDGFLDLAVANSNWGPGRPVSVSILIGKQDGTFDAAAPFVTSSPGQSATWSAIAAADFDGDSLLDLAVTTGNNLDPSGTVFIFLGKKDGTFGLESHRITVGRSPTGLVVGDFDGNGSQDLAVAFPRSSNLLILPGKGNGTFDADQQTIKAGGGSSILADDFNGDNITDLATVSSLGFSASVLVGKGDADSTFELAHNFWAGASPSGLAAGDFNGDGRPDLIVGQNRLDQIALLLNRNFPTPADGVTIERDILYHSQAADPDPSKHMLNLYLPAQQHNFPVVVFAPGGSWSGGNSNRAAYLARTLARDGIGMVVIGNRGNSKDVLLKDIMTDVARAFAWTHQNIGGYGGDPDNIFVMGNSEGAHLLALLATDPTWLRDQNLDLSAIRGAIGVSGIYDLTTFPELTGRLFAGASANPLPAPLSLLLTQAIAFAQEGPNASPVNHVCDDGPPLCDDDPPFLLLHGTDGKTEQSFTLQTHQFYARVIAAGGQAELVPVSNRDHFEMMGLASQSGDPVREAIFNFVAKHQILADLQVTNIVATNSRDHGRTITITATVVNMGANDTRPSQTEFLLDGATVVGLIDTPAIAAGGSATVSISLDTKSLKGTHTIRVTADRPGIVGETDETNNAATLTLTIKGNKTQDGATVTQKSSEPPAEGASAPSSSASGEFVAALLVEEDAFASEDNSTASETAQSEPTSESPLAHIDAFFAAVAEEESSSLLFTRPEQGLLAGLLTDLMRNPLLSTGL